MSTEVRTSNQSRASTKIVIGFVLLLGLAYGGKTLYDNSRLSKISLTPVAPTTVNLVGIDTAKGGYHIVVANRIAQLVQSEQGAFEGANQDDPSGASSDDSDAQKKKVPLKELIETLQGKSDAMGQYVGVLNDMKADDIEPRAKDWSAADIQKAIGGDAKLKERLQGDLNTNLDGSPLPVFRPSTFQAGITIHLPMTLKVSTADGEREVTGDLPFPFKSKLMMALEQRVKDEPNLTDTSLAGFYAEVAKPVQDDPSLRQNIADALSQIISPANTSNLSQLPQTILGTVDVLVNDTMIKSASYSKIDTTKGPLYNIDIELTNEGRDRLWKFTHDQAQTQLLLIVDGVAVAAPRIGGALAETHLTIENMPDETIVKDTVDKINALHKSGD